MLGGLPDKEHLRHPRRHRPLEFHAHIGQFNEAGFASGNGDDVEAGDGGVLGKRRNEEVLPVGTPRVIACAAPIAGENLVVIAPVRADQVDFAGVAERCSQRQPFSTRRPVSSNRQIVGEGLFNPIEEIVKCELSGSGLEIRHGVQHLRAIWREGREVEIGGICIGLNACHNRHLPVLDVEYLDFAVHERVIVAHFVV